MTYPFKPPVVDATLMTHSTCEPTAPVADADRPSHQFGESACPDLPVELGWMIVGLYGAILVGFLAAFADSPETVFMIGVCAVYLAVYLGTPTLLLRMEPPAALERPTLAQFVERGLITSTGPISAQAALVQMLAIPVSLVVAVLGLGVIIRLAA